MAREFVQYVVQLEKGRPRATMGCLCRQGKLQKIQACISDADFLVFLHDTTPTLCHCARSFSAFQQLQDQAGRETNKGSLADFVRSLRKTRGDITGMAGNKGVQMLPPWFKNQGVSRNVDHLHGAASLGKNFQPHQRHDQ